MMAMIWLGLWLIAGPTAWADVLITEFLAGNDTVLADEDGDFRDWIEIFNSGSSTADLGGYYLTDESGNLTKWQIPAGTSLEPSSFLVVFASDKDRAVAGEELHTNFKLSTSGEYLALVAADGSTVLSEFSPEFPAQSTDVSYGLQQSGDRTDEVVVDVDGSCRVWVPDSDVLGLTWTGLGFDDSSWTAGALGVGYERSSGYQDLIETDVEVAMYNLNGSAYIRVPFQVADVNELLGLSLELQYDDGCAIYLNGTYVAGPNAPAAPEWDSQALNDHPDPQSLTFETIDLGDYLHLLQEGENVLALQGMNKNLSSSDFLIRPRLVASRRSESTIGAPSYFTTPTPGAVNGMDQLMLQQQVVISEASQTFFSSFQVTLSGAEVGQEIRYTLDGSLPQREGPLYSGPIEITGSTQIRARVFADSGAYGPTSTETYLFVSEDLRDFKSNLPIIILDNFGGGRPDNKTEMFMAVIPTDESGIAAIGAPFQVATRGTMKVRGSSSSSWNKYSMSIEAWDGDDQDHSIAPLGFPAEADWVLGSKYQFDRALMRNDLAYRLSNDLGEYAARTRHVEVLNNTGGGEVSYAGAYFGVYSLTEKIKRDGDRVDVERMSATDTIEPEVTGGYIFKEDRLDPGDSGFTVDGAGRMAHVYPKEEDITAEQKAWLVSYLNAFDDALNDPSWSHPESGKHFTEYIKQGAWLKHHWINTLTKNVDGFRLSGYYYKDRESKVGAGPVWDFDRTMQSTDGRDDNPETWDGTGDSSKTWSDSRFPWWGRALENPDFRQAHTDFWQSQRADGAFSWAHVEAVIDEFDLVLNTEVANDIGIEGTAQERNFAKWSEVSPRNGSHAAEVTILKDWLRSRMEWIDTQYTARPEFDRSPGQVAPGTVVSFASSAATIYYTLDGSDPRLPGGDVSPSAITGVPITVDETRVITARARLGTGLTSWSGPVQGLFLVGPVADASNLVLSEVHYAPRPPSSPEELAVSSDAADFEFIECRNISDVDTIDLHGVRFIAGIDFDFSSSAVTSLAPGERVLLVRSLAAFRARYGTSYNDCIAGEYASDKLDNAGERIHLVNAFDQTIADFTYSDTFPWPSAAGNPGYSLVMRKASPSLSDYLEARSWRSSGWMDGNPDASDSSRLVGSPGSDHDGDGWMHLLEYVQGTREDEGSDYPEPLSVAVQPLEVEGVESSYLTVTYVRNLTADDAEMELQVSEDLVGWNTGEPHLYFVTEVNQGDGTSRVTYRRPSPHRGDETPECYFRLRVWMP